MQALFLGRGGYGNVYLYKANNEYRVAKVYHFEETGYGGIERCVASFNAIYNTLYYQQLSSLATATATAFEGSKIILDMPYIGGTNYFSQEDRLEVHRKKVSELRQYFVNNGFFVADGEMDGNVMLFCDPKSNVKYILIRDVDVVGRRDSYIQNGENSVTHGILEELDELDSDFSKPLGKYDFLGVLKNEEEKKTDPAAQENFEYNYIKGLLLQKLTPAHTKYDALSKAENFSELCFIAAQKRKKHIFSKDEGFTGVLDQLYELIQSERENIKALIANSRLPLNFTKYDLQEVGFYGKLQPPGENTQLREKNLNYIYSIKNSSDTFKAQITALRSHSIFSVDLSKITVEANTPNTSTPKKSFF